MTDTMRDRFNSTVLDLLVSDPDAVLVLAVIGGGIHRDARRLGVGDRVIDVGIREQTMIGVAGGLALEGFRPIVMSYAPFAVERPYEQIKLSLTHQGVHATIVSVGASWDASGSGRTHQAPEDVALMATLPGWTVHVPGHADEAEDAIRTAHASGMSHYIRLTTDANAEPLGDGAGRIATLRRGSDAAPAILAVGPLADDVLTATAGMDTTVLYTNVVHPIDERGLDAAVVGDTIIVIEPMLAGTSTGQVAAALGHRPMRIGSIGVSDPEIMHYGRPAELRTAHGLDAVGIQRQIEGFMLARTG